MTPIKKHLVKVVVPIYKSTFTDYERISFTRVCSVLNDYPIIVIKPNSLNIDYLRLEQPTLEFESFHDAYFNGISGYNRLMLSEEFYARFVDSTYILICQLDAYVFSDKLTQWCEKDYDYIGAPWLVRPIYNFPLLRFTSWLKKQYCALLNKPNGQITNFKVGNGGFSLRKIDKHLTATRKLKQIIDKDFLARKRHHIYNEDVFWAVEVNKHGLNFKYPDYIEALNFSFDKYPKLCYKLNNNKLPFGCHSWYKRKMKGFWFPIILHTMK